MWMILNFFTLLLESIFPASCISCKQEGSPFCDACLKKLKRAYETPYPFIVSMYSFKEPILKRAIHSIKYFHRRDLLTPFTFVLGEEIKSRSLKGLVCPIPMHPIRKLIRGYNHSEILAKKIAKHAGLPYENLLYRQKFQIQQVKTRSKSERLKNQRNAFNLRGNVTNKDIILIDDVTTTGATLLEARTLLLKNGARSVLAYTIAH